MRATWIAIDWDNTLWDAAQQQPMEGAQDALDAFHSRGWRILIHSANRKEFIQKCCEEHKLYIDDIWDRPGKPDFVTCFIDDRAIRFTNWAEVVPLAIEMAGGRLGRR